MEVANKTLFNGAIYSGNMENNLPHGYGVYETKNIKYEGYFRNGQFDLYGRLTDKNINYTYTGQFKDGMKNGYGEIRFNNGRYFEGLFTDNRCDDYGYMRYFDSEIYVGEFKNNLSHGSGTVYHTNGNMFIGNFKDDKEYGIGVFVEQKNNGYGLKTEYNDDGYCFIHGAIKLTSDLITHMVYRVIEEKDYRFYGMIDKYSNFIKGIYHYDNDSKFSVFIGNITNEFKNGILILKNGDIFKGFYEDDHLTGKGEYTILGKGTYIGEFTDGVKNGEFIFIDYNGNKYYHIYDGDKLVSVREAVQ